VSAHARALRGLTALLTVAVAVSVVHYTDNTVNDADYPESVTLPNPSQAVVFLSWFLFTAFGIAGWLLLRRGAVERACLCLALYSGSGLVGLLHYTVSGTSRFPWWRHAHIVTDIACGLAVIAFALWAAVRLREPGRIATASTSRPPTSTARRSR
jgi:hypothetical protein